MRKIKATALPIPTEDQEQIAVVQYLQAKGLLFTHPANGSNKSPAARVRFKKLGQSAGVPDLLIFNQFSTIDADGSIIRRVGMAIEMKRRNGGKTSSAQIEWRDNLRKCGWSAIVCNGADEAIALIKSAQWVKV